MTLPRRCWCGAQTAAWECDFEVPEQGAFTMVRCDGCGVRALHPPPTDEQLRLAYASTYYGSSARKFIVPVATVIDFFQGGRARFATRQVESGGNVLDVGCGNGGFLRQMKRRGHQVQGTEWSDLAARRVDEHSEEPITVHVGDLTDLGLPAASFDLITLWHVFEHLRDPHATLNEIRRLLRPSGTLLMSMPNVEGDQAQRFGKHWLHHDPPRHLFGFGPETLRSIFARTGFRLVDHHTRSLEQNPFGFIQSWSNQFTANEGRPRDLLYEALKGRDVRATALDWWRALLMIPVAIVTDQRESKRKHGATITVIVRPISDS